ncbi:MAG: chemotaxis-specific protein-glutamate methyltransferase CheB [Croceibacterium sp.]
MSAAHTIAVDAVPATGPEGPVRVLVVDDSPTVRAVMARIIGAERDLEVAATDGSAESALATLQRTTADVIMLDLDMPGMGGLEAIPKMLKASQPARILVVSALAERGAEHTLNALSLGAADTLAKPRAGEFDAAYRALLLRKVRLLGRVARRVRMRTGNAPSRPLLRSYPREVPDVLAIGASTGGIHALGRLLASLPQRLALPILVTQHLPGTFTDAFIRQLHNASGRATLVAKDGTVVLPGQILVAPGDAHLTVAADRRGAVVKLETNPAPSGCRPSVDPMFASIAQVYGAHALGVVLSGMGRDGAIGAERIVAAGGTIMAQDAASCAVWGMPGAVVEAGLASAILPPEQLAMRIVAASETR